MSRKATLQIYLEEDAMEKLRALSHHTKRPAASFVREAIDDLLRKYRPKGGSSPDLREADDE